MYLTFNRDDKFLEEEFYHLSFPYLKFFVLKIQKQKKNLHVPNVIC